MSTIEDKYVMVRYLTAFSAVSWYQHRFIEIIKKQPRTSLAEWWIKQ